MLEVQRTSVFADWLDGLKDRVGRARIIDRIDRLMHGNPGNTKPVGSGVMELRMDFGPGYRVYYIEHGRTLVILLAGGDKSSQRKDIKMAIALAAQFRS